ncbi:carboxyl-terminal processing protease CtpB [Leptolyngbya sp. FACHB-711]|uniref:carboxyl-terminal processing protease CtpB n=1 Tax=unclassified Leptolyngbya TaxID=2650499 RepID=UPI001687BB39|nr:carboxyl-terminal processing protease CtpB [Leptolyngbya sp. FACHB-711]MBD1851592.1 S41 family peptidase [Cyanobacteria bacterium FACHB-502]MBD2026395.1 S41 family peptidase [Leptolyngbya sp. FACHB-711]
MNDLPCLSRLLQGVCFGGTLAVVTVLSPLYSTAQAAFQNNPKAVLDEAWQIVDREYVDTTFNRVNWQAVRQDLLSRDYTSPEAAYAALREALEQLNDPYTRFLDPKQYQTLTSQTSGELSGVGLRLQLHEETKALTVVEPLANSPASAAGIQTGDRILAIDGRSTTGMSVETASELIKGEAGTRITLRIERESRAAFDLPLTRARIELPNVAHELRQEGNQRIGYIRLTEFSSHAPDQMKKAIEDLLSKNVNGFVLDLRGNPGGLLHASVEISRMWLDGGAIVRTVDRHGNSDQIMANHTALTQLPLAVLVDGNSASSSEIVTGALMDNQRAVIVGTRTFGKALVQAVHSLSDGSGLAVTVAHYYTPGGTDISQRGITPNVEVSLNEQQQQTLARNLSLVGTNADPQYAQAVNVLRPTIAQTRLPSRVVQPSVSLGQEQTRRLN